MAEVHCSFITVPDPSLSIAVGRYVICRRTPEQHPVKGEGRFVNHQFCLDRYGKRVQRG